MPDASTTVDAVDLASHRQDRLIGLLACPTCTGKVKLEGAIRAHAMVVSAQIICTSCGVVGTIRDRRPTFLDRDLVDPVIPANVVAEAVDLLSCRRQGQWSAVDQGLLGDGVGASMSGRVKGEGVAFELGTHAWSGRAFLRCGDHHRLVDLYTEMPGGTTVAFSGLPAGTWSWSVEVADGRPPGSAGDQVIVRQVGALVPAADAGQTSFAPVNRGNPYPPRFEQLLRDQPSDAIVFDIGGGDRVHEDERVINLEYLPYKGPDLYGDGHHLPIRSDSVDLVLSQAVLEHVPDPKAAVAEIRRILRPGGLAYVEIAFMQPLHAVPFHFFNVTPHGRALLFEDFDILRQGSFGGLAETVEWFFRLVDAHGRLGHAKASAMLADLAVLDATLTAEELEQFASGVYVEACKPA